MSLIGSVLYSIKVMLIFKCKIFYSGSHSFPPDSKANFIERKWGKKCTSFLISNNNHC